MRLDWLRLALFMAVPFFILGSWFRIVHFLQPFEGQWGWIGVMFGADISAILALVSIIQRVSPLRTTLDAAALFLSLVAHSVAFIFATFPNGLNPIRVAASSVGVGFGALVFATCKELAQKTTGKSAIKSAHPAINLNRQAGPATVFLIAALVCLPFVWPVFAYIDHMC